LPDQLLTKYPVIAIPQFNPKARSLNLSSCVAIVLYEAIRQVTSSA
jgi:tRNA(Leu) C34 or U34 (ribose-2'-O)-methylase TrmL